MKKHSHVALLALMAGLLLLSGCARVIPGQVAVKRTLGRFKEKTYSPGIYLYNPFVSVFNRLPTQVVNLKIEMGLPSKEGLTIQSEVSILYHVQADKAIDILTNVGRRYEQELILPIFRSAASDVCARFYAKDMHSAERAVIEKAIQKRLEEDLAERGFIIENVLLKRIILPQGLASAIEDKLRAEQEAMRMEFVLQQQQKQAQLGVVDAEAAKQIAKIRAEGEREATIINAQAEKQRVEIEAEGRANALKVEAEAQKKFNETVGASLTPSLLRYKGIEAFEQLSTSNNTKTIITDGKGEVLNVLPND